MMTDQYYGREDNLPETAEVALSTWREQVSGLSNVVPETAEGLNQIHDALGHLWTQAAGAGDAGAQAMIDHIWNTAERDASKVVQLDAAIKAALTVAKKLDDERLAVIQEQAALQDAIESLDEDHPLLRDFADTIREESSDDFQLWFEEEGWPEAMAEAFEHFQGAFMERIRALTGADENTARRFMRMFFANRDLPDYQADLLRTLVYSFEVAMAGV